MKLEAMHNYLVVEVDGASERETESGLILPENAKPVPTTGVVVSVGPDAMLAFKPGERVVFPPYGIGHRVKLETAGPEYLIILDHEILGVVDGD